jgi:hypothetical protein
MEKNNNGPLTSLQHELYCRKSNLNGEILFGLSTLIIAIVIGVVLKNIIVNETTTSTEVQTTLKIIGLSLLIILFTFLSRCYFKNAWAEYEALQKRLGKDTHPLQFKCAMTIILSFFIWCCIKAISLIWNDAHRPFLQCTFIIIVTIVIAILIATIISEWRPKQD